MNAVLQPVKAVRSALGRRRAARDAMARRAEAERLTGLFADVDPGSSWADELIADRRVEAAAEARDEADYLARRRDASPHVGR
jgi:hypothetical protein